MKSRYKPICSTVTALALILGANLGHSQSKNQSQCMVEDIDIPILPSCVIQSRHGILFIPKRYWMHSAFNEYGLVPFTIQSSDRLYGVYVNRTGRVVVQDVAFMDNAPDEFHHGLVRVERDGKWGFVGPSGKIVVSIEYSCAANYKDQYEDIGPLVCIGCRRELQGEYHVCLGGQWYLTDSRGKLTPSALPK